MYDSLEHPLIHCLLQTMLTMFPVITSFLPPTHTELYLPPLFKLWEAINSSILDDRMIDLCGDLSEEHVAGKLGDAGEEGGAAWKDIGIWSENEWHILANKALGSMSKSAVHLSWGLVVDVNLRCPCWCHSCKSWVHLRWLRWIYECRAGRKYNGVARGPYGRQADIENTQAHQPS